MLPLSSVLRPLFRDACAAAGITLEDAGITLPVQINRNNDLSDTIVWSLNGKWHNKVERRLLAILHPSASDLATRWATDLAAALGADHTYGTYERTFNVPQETTPDVPLCNIRDAIEAACWSTMRDDPNLAHASVTIELRLSAADPLSVDVNLWTGSFVAGPEREAERVRALILPHAEALQHAQSPLRDGLTWLGAHWRFNRPTGHALMRMAAGGVVATS